jgi:hypothetical protein
VKEAWEKRDEDNILVLFYEDLKMVICSVQTFKIVIPYCLVIKVRNYKNNAKYI